MHAPAPLKTYHERNSPLGASPPAHIDVSLLGANPQSDVDSPLSSAADQSWPAPVAGNPNP